MTHIDAESAAEQLGREIGRHASEYAPRRRRAPEVVAPPPQEAASDQSPAVVTHQQELTPNAARIATQIDAIYRDRDQAISERDQAMHALHAVSARVEQKEATINSQASEITALKLERDALQAKHTRLYSIIRSLRAATDEVVDMENGG